MMTTTPKYLLIINRMSPLSAREWESFQALPGRHNLEQLVLAPASRAAEAQNLGLAFVPCDFSSDKEIELALAPYQGAISAVFCAGETNIQYLRRIIPLLPKEVLVASPAALEHSTNKYAMREAFSALYPEITPRFLEVKNASQATLKQIESALTYPVIVKPANLASSLLIQACHSPGELQASLSDIFTVVHDVYRDQKRTDAPVVLVEEFLEGNFYSTDAYVMEPGKVFVCPPVAYMSNNQRGIDDFSLYKRWIPTTLDTHQQQQLARVTAQAIEAVGLTHSSVHIELILTKNGWKVIELGPRIGRYRHRMYQYSYGINHYANDARIHLGHEPIIPSMLHEYCAAYSIYPEKEGTLREITGLEFLRSNPNIRHLTIHARPGDACLHAKHGGKIIAEFYVTSKDKDAFERTVAEVEMRVVALTD